MADSREVNSEPAHENEREGSGERNARAESGLTEIREARLTARAVEQGWIKSRFETHTPVDALLARIEEGSANSAEKALLTANRLMDSTKERSNGIGARIVVSMVRINQTDDLHALNAGSDPAVHGAVPAAPNEVCSAMDASVPDAAAG